MRDEIRSKLPNERKSISLDRTGQNDNVAQLPRIEENSNLESVEFSFVKHPSPDLVKRSLAISHTDTNPHSLINYQLSLVFARESHVNRCCWYFQLICVNARPFCRKARLSPPN
jgi:hypothetical protein